jgi:hypothetical protein
MLTEIAIKNVQSNGDHLNWESLAENTGHLILVPKG